MTPEEIHDRVHDAAIACQQKDALGFASLFLPDGEVILPKHRLVGKDAIARATDEYLSNCEEIEIEIQQILVDNNRATVKWVWQDRKKSTGQVNRRENTIVIDFQEGVIARWQEY